MKSKYRMTTAVGALLAALSLGAVAAAQEVNTDNGVHAVPSGKVTVALLGPGGTPVPAEAGDDQKVKTVKVDTPAATQVAENAVDAAEPAEPPAPPARVQLADLARHPSEAHPLDQPLTPAEEAAEEKAEAHADQASQTAPAQSDRVDAAGPADQASPVQDAAEPASAHRNVRRAEAAPPQDEGIKQHVAFPRDSIEAAAAFDRYMRAAGAIGADFHGGAGVATALRTATGYDPHQFEKGMIAYGAIAALQEADFVYAVMDAAARADERAALAEQILADPYTVTRLHGADAAAARAAASIGREAAPVVGAGRAVKRASYDIQHQSWSVETVADGAARLADAKSASARPLAAEDKDIAGLLTTVSTMTAPDGGRGGSSYTPVAVRSAALAALAILDGDQGEDADRYASLTSERISADCLKMAKLNLFQCLAVAGPEYEDVYCMGQHAISDTGQCVAAAADPSPALQMSALSTDVMVPAGGGRGRAEQARGVADGER